MLERIAVVLNIIDEFGAVVTVSGCMIHGDGKRQQDPAVLFKVFSE